MGDKRRKTVAGDEEKPSISSERSSSEDSESNFPLNDLRTLLIEVLQRLPTAKSAILCKYVCKNWYSLISTPYFVRRFITHHINHQYKQNPSSLIINYWTKSSDFGLFTLSDEPMFKSRGFELNYLPKKNLPIRAIFNDLMLCSLDERHYFICNPFTMEWIGLPLLKHDIKLDTRLTGFVCEPYCFEDSHGEYDINCRYRFRVVCIEKSGYKQFTVITYCSETQKWHTFVLEGSEYEFRTDFVAYNGKLLGYNGQDIFAYDAFNPELSTFIDCSYIQSTKCSYGFAYCIGVCRGFLRLMQHTTDRVLAIWELKNYTTWEWSLEGKFFLDTMIPRSSLVWESLDGALRIRLLGFNPSDGDIVYLESGPFIISCNLQTSELKMVGEVPASFDGGNVFRIELPVWPTPILKTN